MSGQAPCSGLLCKVSKPVIQTALAFGDKCRRIRSSLCPRRRLLLRKNTGRQPRTLVCRVTRPLPGNAAADFTATVILMMLLSHWFIQVTIHQISRNFITDAKAERVPRFQLMCHHWFCSASSFYNWLVARVNAWNIRAVRKQRQAVLVRTSSLGCIVP